MINSIYIVPGPDGLCSDGSIVDCTPRLMTSNITTSTTTPPPLQLHHHVQVNTNHNNNTMHHHSTASLQHDNDNTPSMNHPHHTTTTSSTLHKHSNDHHHHQNVTINLSPNNTENDALGNGNSINLSTSNSGLSHHHHHNQQQHHNQQHHNQQQDDYDPNSGSLAYMSPVVPLEVENMENVSFVDISDTNMYFDVITSNTGSVQVNNVTVSSNSNHLNNSNNLSSNNNVSSSNNNNSNNSNSTTTSSSNSICSSTNSLAVSSGLQHLHHQDKYPTPKTQLLVRAYSDYLLQHTSLDTAASPASADNSAQQMADHHNMEETLSHHITEIDDATAHHMNEISDTATHHLLGNMNNDAEFVVLSDEIFRSSNIPYIRNKTMPNNKRNTSVLLNVHDANESSTASNLQLHTQTDKQQQFKGKNSMQTSTNHMLRNDFMQSQGNSQQQPSQFKLQSTASGSQEHLQQLQKSSPVNVDHSGGVFKIAKVDNFRTIGRATHSEVTGQNLLSVNFSNSLSVSGQLQQIDPMSRQFNNNHMQHLIDEPQSSNNNHHQNQQLQLTSILQQQLQQQQEPQQNIQQLKLLKLQTMNSQDELDPLNQLYFDKNTDTLPITSDAIVPHQQLVDIPVQHMQHHQQLQSNNNTPQVNSEHKMQLLQQQQPMPRKLQQKLLLGNNPIQLKVLHKQPLYQQQQLTQQQQQIIPDLQQQQQSSGDTSNSNSRNTIQQVKGLSRQVPSKAPGPSSVGTNYTMVSRSGRVIKRRPEYIAFVKQTNSNKGDDIDDEDDDPDDPITSAQPSPVTTHSITLSTPSQQRYQQHNLNCVQSANDDNIHGSPNPSEHPTSLNNYSNKVSIRSTESCILNDAVGNNDYSQLPAQSATVPSSITTSESFVDANNKMPRVFKMETNYFGSVDIDTSTVFEDVVDHSNDDDDTEDSAAYGNDGKKSLPHKKRIPRKLKNTKKHAKCYKCMLCSEQFASSQLFQQHKITHTPTPTKVKPHSCELCTKSFETQLKFFEHLKSHYEPAKRFKCEVCSGDFESPEVLQEHLAVHQRQHFQCSTCNKTFRKGVLLTNHINAMHAAVEEEPILKSFPCPECPAVFFNIVARDEHLATEHKSMAAPDCDDAVENVHMTSTQTLHSCDICFQVR